MITHDTIVIGGGLGGMATAALLARGGQRVLLLEKADHLGGRARSRETHGFTFNRGPHALYRGGPAMEVLAEIGVSPSGAPPRPRRSFAISDGVTHRMPTTPLAMLTTSLLRWRARVEVAKALGGVGRLDPAAHADRSAADWIAARVQDPIARALVAMGTRVATYAGDLEQLSADAAIAQLSGATGRGVLYLDGGWQSLVDATRTRIDASGAQIITGARVERVHPDADGVRVDTPSATHRARHAVVAGSPGLLARLLDRPSPPVTSARASSLDLGLSAQGAPIPDFALEFDDHLYFSVHSRVARVGPHGGVTVSVARYLGGEDDCADSRPRLERFLDRLVPDWRDRVVAQQYLPEMTVVTDLPTPGRGGLAGRPRVTDTGEPRVLAVGDWIGPRHMLLDAALASARDASRHILTSDRVRSTAA